MPDRYLTLVIKLPDSFDPELDQQVIDGLAAPVGAEHAWVTDYLPEDPNTETRHLLLVTADSWVLQHPVSCRIGNRLWHCPITRACERSAALNGGVVWRRSGAGLYPVSLNKTGGLHFDVKAKEPLP